MIVRFIKDFLTMETQLVDKYRAKGYRVVKPSTVLSILVTLFYTLSPIDIVPEKFVKPLVFGVIDDLLFITITAIFCYSDIGGELIDAVQNRGVPRTKEPIEEIDVPVQDRLEEPFTSIPVTSTSEPVSDSIQVSDPGDDIDGSNVDDEFVVDDNQIADFISQLGKATADSSGDN